MTTKTICRLLSSLVLFLCLVAAAGCAGPGRAPQQTEADAMAGAGSHVDGTSGDFIAAKVKSVVDGDTIRVTLKNGAEEKVRLIGVNTPESTNKIEPYGKQAAEYTAKRLEGLDVWLETDVEKRDRYNRLLAYVWLKVPGGGEPGEEVRSAMFNAQLLLEGYAQVMTVPPNVKYVDYFTAYQREAREGNRGLWGPAGEAAGRVTEKYYVASTNSDKFHRPQCRWARQIHRDNLKRFATLDDALDAGYQPCGTCKP